MEYEEGLSLPLGAALAALAGCAGNDWAAHRAEVAGEAMLGCAGLRVEGVLGRLREWGAIDGPTIEAVNGHLIRHSWSAAVQIGHGLASPILFLSARLESVPGKEAVYFTTSGPEPRDYAELIAVEALALPCAAWVGGSLLAFDEPVTGLLGRTVPPWAAVVSRASTPAA